MNNTIKIYGVFNEDGMLLCAFTCEFELQDYVIEREDSGQQLYVTEGTINQPDIGSDNDTQ